MTTIQNTSVEKYCEDKNGRLFILPKRKDMIIPNIIYNPIKPKQKIEIVRPNIKYNPIKEPKKDGIVFTEIKYNPTK